MKMQKRLLALFLALLVGTMAVSVPVNAADTFEVYTSDDWKYYVMEDGTAALVQYIGTAVNLTIPKEINRIPVTALADQVPVFGNTTTVKTVTIEENITKVGACAFIYNTSIEEITIRANDLQIGMGAFADCSSLKRIDISADAIILVPDTETGLNLGNAATESGALFEGCESLETVIFSGDITQTVPGVPWFDAQCVQLKTATFKNGKITAPFLCAGLPSLEIVNFDNAIISVGEYAFASCVSLKEIIIPDGSDIGEYAFADCNSLVSVTIGEQVSIAAHAFDSCESLQSVSIGNQTVLGDYSFYDCQNLKHVYFLDDAVSIGDYAFANCVRLVDLQYPIILNQLGSFVLENALPADFIVPQECSQIGMNAISVYGNIYIYSSDIPLCELQNLKIANTDIIGVDDEIVDKYIQWYRAALLSPIYSDEAEFSTMLSNKFEELFGFSVESEKAAEVIAQVEAGTVTGEEYSPHWQTVYGYAGTAAEQFAAENNLKFSCLHDWEDVGGAQVCRYCGAVQGSCTVHTFGDWQIIAPATCTENGQKKRSCTICGAEETESIPASHALQTVEISSTCAVAGVQYDVCLVCDEIFNQKVLPLSEIHSFTAWQVRVEPSCEAKGQEARVCTICGKEETKALPELGHRFGDWTVTVQPTYLKTGVQETICLRCGSKKTEILPTLQPDQSIRENASGIELWYQKETYPVDMQLEVTPTFDGASYQLISMEKGGFTYMLYDIITTVDGVKIQPTGAVLVRIPLPEGYSTERTVVYYVANDGSGIEKIDSYYADGYICFETDHFSHYAIVDETSTRPTCSHFCHSENPFISFIYRIVCFFWRLFSIHQVCDCGVYHY